jgi:hypothetical protein
MRRTREEGQATIFVSLFLALAGIAALGLAMDGGQLYVNRQKAQAAADAGAQAGIMSIFDGTNTGTNAFGSSTFTCSATDARTPCVYTRMNGFSADTVVVDFPGSAAAPGVSLSGTDAVNLIRVTITRTSNTTFMRILGTTTSSIQAVGIAAIVNTPSPIPIVVTHPTLSGALSTNGTGNTPKIKIIGGPSRSIQVNSSSTTSLSASGQGEIDLSQAGPNDTGGDFGDWGGPSSSPFPLLLGTTGHYVEPASPILDPLAGVTPPSAPPLAQTPTALANGVNGCPAAPRKPCMLYYPGEYTTANQGSIDVKNQTAVFSPGIYYMYGVDFHAESNGDMFMATGLTDGTTGTGWTGNMLVYMTGPANGAGVVSTGAITVSSNSTVSLVGSPTSSSYQGILFFVNRAAASQTHNLDGGGGLSLIGTIYATDTLANMGAGHYQTLSFQGNAGSSTSITGEIITSVLTLGGTPNITMNLSSIPSTSVRQVALVQ